MIKPKGFLETTMANSKIVFLLVAILVAFGIYGLDKMNKQEFPEFTVRFGIVAAVYPGASADDIERQVTTPLEDYLFTFPEVNKNKTYSFTKEGVTYINVTLANTVKNQTIAWSKIRHGLDNFKAQLPTGVLAIAVIDDFDNASAVMIAMDAKDKTYREMGRYMDQLKTQLRTIPAANNIRIYGEQKEVMSVYVDKQKLATYGISHTTLTSQLLSQGLQSIGGTVGNDVMNIPVYVDSPVQNEKELGSLVVCTTPDGHSIRLRDVARIEREYQTPSSFITKDGRDALVLSIDMRAGNNIVKFGEEVNRVMADFQRTLPDGVNLYRITDLPKVVDDSIWSFLKDLLTAILVVIAVMLLLFPFSSAMVPAIEIPLTTAITISVMYIIGFEMNTVTLAALIVTLGMIVDDSIVMIDGYMDNMRHGMSPWDAALSSAKTFFTPLVIATISITAIFFPFLFTMEGALGDFVKFFPTTIGISLFISLALAMLLTPYLEFKMIKPEEERNARLSQLEGRGVAFRKFHNRFESIQSRFFVLLQDGYEWLLTRCFQHPWRTLSVGIGSVVAAVVIFLNLPLQLMPMAERDSFAVEIYLPEGSTLQQTERVCQKFEKVLHQCDSIESVTTFVGNGSPRFMATYIPKRPSRNYAQMIVNTTSASVTEGVIKKYKDTYIDSFPEAQIRVKQLDYQAVNNPVEIQLRSYDQQALRQYGDTLKAFLHQHEDDLVWIHSDWDGYVPTIKITLKPEEASQLGVTKAVLSANLASLFGGLPVTSVWEDDYKVAVQLKVDNPNGYTQKDSTLHSAGDYHNFADIENAIVPTALPGVWVPLRQVATIEPDWKPAQIAHLNGMPCLTVAADLRFGGSQPVVMKKLRPYLENEFKGMLPEDVEMTYGGLDSVNADNMGGIIIGLIAAILIVFFFLLFNFKKIRLTLLALCGTSLCLLGAFIGLWIFGCDVSLTAIIGIVSLIGINVRNTIVMFDYAEQLREEGLPMKIVAYESGRRRMRPIFLTSATTAVGVIPMIIHKSTLWMPMGIVICFGTICAITFIVTVLPVAYWKLFDKTTPQND